MITKQIIQSALEELKSISGVDFYVMDYQGLEMGSTFHSQAEFGLSLLKAFIQSPADSQIIGGQHLFKVKDDQEAAYVLLSKGSGTDGYIFGKVAVSQIQQLLLAYREKYDRNGFYQNLLLDNMLLVDIYTRARKLHINLEAKRIVFLVEAKNDKERTVSDILGTLFAEKMEDFITAVDEKNLILIHQMDDGETLEDIDQMAQMIVDVINTEAMVTAKVAYGTVVNELREVSRSYKEAKLAIDVAKIFYVDRDTVSYNTLGIGRLIYQLPVNLCKMFIEEIFGDNDPTEIDEELLSTANLFFDNNLNVSETSRQLYVHRNTLVYRIEKLAKITNMDIRLFDDALTLKIALMVVNYVKYQESNNLF